MSDQRGIAAVREAQGAPGSYGPGSDGGSTSESGNRGRRSTQRSASWSPSAPSDDFALLETVLAFNYGQDLRRVTVPTLVTHNQDDQFMRNQSPWAFRLLTSLAPENKELVFLDAAIGGQLHDQPVGPQVGQEIVFDWLGERLGV